MVKTMLNENELAAVTNRLQIPLIVTDILDGEGELTDDVQFGIHEIISDLQPDTALLCIALSARKIAGIYSKASASMGVLDLECERILSEYGPLWLQNAAHQDIDELQVLDALSHVHEDLEYIAELLELNISFLRAKDETAARLCEILLIQSTAHAMIAEEFLSAVNIGTKEEDTNVVALAQDTAHKALANDNVIPFPVQTER